MGAVVIKAWREIRGKLGVCDRSVTGGVSRKLRRWGEWGILIHFWQGASSSGMLGRLCCVNFRLPGVGFCRSGVRYRRLGVRCPLPVGMINFNLSALRARGIAFRRGWDACAARSKVGPVMGLRPLRGPPCIPPEAPPKRVISIPCAARARGSSCGSFLPSLRSVRRSPSAPRKCHSPLSRWAKSASAEYPNYALCIEAGAVDQITSYKK